MSSKFNFTDTQWYNFICGFHAGLKLKDLTLPDYDTNIVLHPIGVGGWGTIGLGIPKLVYDGVNKTGVIPIFVHDVDIDYSGFSVNIKWDDTRLRFEGVEAGDFGTIGNTSSSADIKYSYSKGNFKARGIRPYTVKFKEPCVLFYINATIIDTVTRDNPIDIKFINSNFTSLDYTTLLKWVEVTPGGWYNFFITPLLNIDGAIISDEESSWDDSSKQAVGEDTTVAAKASPSGVFVGTANTPPGCRGVVPIYSNSNIDDNFPYSGVHCKIVVEDDSNKFDYIEVSGAGGFDVEVTPTRLSNGHLILDITAHRSEALSDSITFCYIEYYINTSDSSYVIPLRNELSELMN